MWCAADVADWWDKQRADTSKILDESTYWRTKKYNAGNAKKLLAADLDRTELAKARLPYERLDQLTMEVLMGVR